MNTIELIRKNMVLRGWSEYRLAKESGLSQSTIANIFRRNTLPSIPTLEIICNAFGISLSQFFDESTVNSLTAEQIELLNKWCFLTKKQKKLVLSIIEEMLKKEIS